MTDEKVGNTKNPRDQSKPRRRRELRKRLRRSRDPKMKLPQEDRRRPMRGLIEKNLRPCTGS